MIKMSTWMPWNLGRKDFPQKSDRELLFIIAADQQNWRLRTDRICLHTCARHRETLLLWQQGVGRLRSTVTGAVWTQLQWDVDRTWWALVLWIGSVLVVLSPLGGLLLCRQRCELSRLLDERHAVEIVPPEHLLFNPATHTMVSELQIQQPRSRFTPSSLNSLCDANERVPNRSIL